MIFGYKNIWKNNFLKAIKKAYENGDISKSSYYELKRIAEEKEKCQKKNGK